MAAVRSKRPPAHHAAAGVLLMLYVVFGVLYGLRTPLWQNPDEPAHYAYLHQIADGGGIPLLQAGDYDQAGIERLMAARFPATMPVDTLRYEGHQPPLYYLTGALLDRALTDRDVSTRVRALRLLGVLLGAGIVFAAYRCGLLLFPERPLLGVAVAVWPALLPQHVAMTAAVNNDALGWLLCALVLWGALRLARQPSWLGTPRWAAVLGVLMGAALVTKTTAYVCLALPLVSLTVTAGARKEPLWRLLRLTAPAYVIAGLIGGLWLLRNMSVYGVLDPLGLTRHNAIVVGQPLAAGWDASALRSLLTTLFQSGWVQLGWMAVPAQPWVYAVLAGVTGVLSGGAALAAKRGEWSGVIGRTHLVLLATAVGLAVAQVAYYNLQFLQPQGRYLFSALVPAGGLLAAGLPLLAGERRLGWVLLALSGLLIWLNVHVLTGLIPFLQP